MTKLLFLNQKYNYEATFIVFNNYSMCKGSK